MPNNSGPPQRRENNRNTVHAQVANVSGTGGNAQSLMVQGESYQGPLPHPDHFARFEVILPGAAHRILVMAESQSKHRQSLERREQLIDAVLHGFGMVLACGIAVTLIVSSYLLITKGCQVTGTIMGGGSVIALVALFFYKRRHKP